MALYQARTLTSVFLVGAGISVGAGIPDFRSSEGVFKSLKRDNPKLASGKDLFNADVFKVRTALGPGALSSSPSA